ncbi:MAG: conjugal transfer protein TrbI [Alphaproteobacteria bacterium]|nr:MAG: conjugal transfer protein TrbI [Alphaproteobacteria bacterium]
MNASVSTPLAPPPDLALRARPPSPKRLSRKVIFAGLILAGLVITFALVSGLSERPDRRGDAAETAVAAAGGPPESIQQASADYDARALIGGETLGLDFDPLTADDVAELMPPTDPMWANARGGDSSGARETPPDPQALARASPILFAGREASARSDGDADRLDARLSPPRSRYELQAGHVIPAALVTALNSDLPGRVIAQVTAPVYDSVTGDHLLIPQGSRLIGTYRDGARYGDSRILLAWNRLILPNGWSINLENMDASDVSGASGLTDRTDNHLDRLVAAIALSSIITVTANEVEDNESGGIVPSLGDAAAQQTAQTGARIVDRDLTVRPTLRVRAGAPVRVLVTRDIVLRRYR